MLIHPATASDLPAFLDLLESAAAWLWARGIRQWEPGAMRAQETALLRATRHGELVVAHDGTSLAGGCVLSVEATPEWRGRAGDARYLHKLVVARSHAGRGIAAALLDWCAARAKAQGATLLRLDCWDGNARLRAFYRDAGFREGDAVASFGYTVRLFERDAG